ncbi:MAG TPA: MFS transporter [Xanthomonadales bacterium]|nr:MFS transporter [Xanthomonadales bacterium]
MTHPRWLTRNLLLLGLASLFTDLSSHVVFPLVPLFVTSVLGAGGVAVGLIEGTAETVSALLKGWAGKWSDHLRRRQPFVVAGYAVSTAVKLLFAFASSWPLVLFARATERIGKGLRSAPRDAIVADEVPAQARGRAFGFQRAMDASGAFLGALAAWWMLGFLDFREIFLWAVLPGVLGVAAAMLVREPAHPAGVRDPAQPRAPRPRFRDLPRELKLAILGCAVFALGQFGIAFFLLSAKAEGLGNRDAMLLYVVFNAANALASMPAGRLSDRFGRLALLIVGYAVFVLACIAAFVADGVPVLLAGFAVYGVAMAIVDGTQRALVADLAPPPLRATAMGAYHGAIALVALPGGYVAGSLWDSLSPHATFAFGAACAVAAALALSVLRRGGRAAAAH